MVNNQLLMIKKSAHSKGIPIKLIKLAIPVWLIGIIVCPQILRSQTLVSFNVPTSMCSGSSQTVTFGYSAHHNVVIGEEGSTLGHSERIFLPDGVPCGSMGCSYRSLVTFTAFTPGATITSVEDIKYLRVNMEHSFIGDLYIGITCPNGQKASLLKYSNHGESDCMSTIPQSHRGWASGDNVSVSTFLGDANDEQSSAYPCDSTISGNRPGIGWNYCWSNNTTSGYSYAQAASVDDGIIYRYGHAIPSGTGSDAIIDSSNVEEKTNFYHPDQNFSSLIGCPLNGDWFIEVLDGWSGDNGYIFEWELSLDAELIPQDTCIADSFSVTGYGVRKINDSVFVINAPQALTHDTTIYYNYHVYSSCDKDIDSTVALTFRALFSHIDTTICDNHPVVVETTSLNETGVHTVTLTTGAQCDSVVEVSLTAHPHYDIHLHEAVCKSDGYEFEDSMYYRPGTYVHYHTTDEGCDSIVTLHLGVLSENLKAEIKAIPPLVTPTDLDFQLYDCSHASSSCLWIVEGNEYNDRHLTYSYPIEADSLPLTLLAYSAEGCIDTATAVIHIDRSTMFTPNVFTPSESTNSTWQPGMSDILSMEVWIYNREGLLVCHLEGPDAKWDGTRNGDPCPQGAYVYSLLYRSVAQPEKQQKVSGTILLLR